MKQGRLLFGYRGTRCAAGAFWERSSPDTSGVCKFCVSFGQPQVNPSCKVPARGVRIIFGPLYRNHEGTGGLDYDA